MVGSGKTRVLLVEGEGIMREGLRALFDQQPDLEVIGEDHSLSGTSAAIDVPAPDVVVVNIITPGAASLGAIRRICQECPDAKVIALSALSNRFFLGEVLRAGVRGYVALQSPFDELLEAVRTVAAGLTYLCSRVRRHVIGDFARVGRDDPGVSETVLTERERRVLRFLAEGQTSKEIALAQGLSSKTIDACRRRLMRKLDVGSMAGLVKCAILMGMTTAAPRPER